MDARGLAALVVLLLTSALLMLIFHNRFWAPADEGNYAHVAQRLLSGETLHRDVQDVHAGYIDFVNAAALSLFGVRLVSLRYPLAGLTIVQSGLMFLLLRQRGIVTALLGGLTLTTLTFVQFLNPTANWYCLFLTTCTIAWLWWTPPNHRGRYLVAGFLVGTTFLFRQLSGVFLGVGVLTFFLLERPRTLPAERRVLAHVVILALVAIIAGYVAHATDAMGWLLLGLWPFPVLLHAWKRTGVANHEIATVLGGLGAGAMIAAVPLIGYHIVHGSVRAWLGDSFGAAVSLPSLEFIRRPGYLMMALLAWHGIRFGDLAARLNGAFWLGILSLTPVLAILTLRSLTRTPGQPGIRPLPVIALFYALVSLHYQLPIYLFYTVGLTLSAILWLTTEVKNAVAVIGLSAAAFLGGVGLYYQAAMPLSRGLRGIVAGERHWPDAPLPRSVAGLYVDSEDAARYGRLIALVEGETRTGDSIFAFPGNAELYFLARRTNPFRFFNTALGLHSPADLHDAQRLLRCHPPKLIFYNPQDKYNTAASVALASVVRDNYEPLAPAPPFEVYRPPTGRPLNLVEGPACSAPQRP